MFERDPQRVAQECHHHMSLHAGLQLVKQGPHREFALQRPERRFGLRQLHVLRPQLFGRLRLEIGTQQISAFARFTPALAIFFDLPKQPHAFHRIPQSKVIQIVHLRMPGLNLSQPPFHLVAVFQPSLDDGYLQTFQRGFHSVGKTISDGLLLFLAALGAAQNVSLLSLWYGHLLHFHFGPDARPVFLQQFRFKLLHLTARRARQILSIALAIRCQILFAHNAAIKHPDPARLAILALYHAQDRLHGGNVGAVAVEWFVAEREAFIIPNHPDHQLLAVGPVIPRVALLYLLIGSPSSPLLASRTVFKHP